jgi:hypothetical protein
VKPRVEIPLALLLAVAVRTPFWAEALRTPLDGDTAVVGLMARHLGEGTTFWGQPYGSPLEAWLAAPLVASLGPRADPLRLLYFLLGLALVPLAYALARRLDPRAALPAAVLMACPPPYFLLLSALPPPLYPTSLLLGGALVVIALGVLAAGEKNVRGRLVLWGLLAGLALWTHLMTASVVAVTGFVLARRRPRREWAWAFVPLLLAGGPLFLRLGPGNEATRIVSLESRQESFADHLAGLLPRIHEPIGGLLGTHVPLVADDPEHVVLAPPMVAGLVVLFYGVGLVLAIRKARGRPAALLLLAVAATVVALYPLPQRSSPDSIRFLSLLYLPLVALMAWMPLLPGNARPSWIMVLSLACLHLLGGTRLLAAWRSADRSAAPFLGPDLGPVLSLLEAQGIRRAYASYAPAYRLTYESDERIVASPPWNARFLHHPQPLLDEVRFARDAAWVLTPAVPSDLPSPAEFEQALRVLGGRWQRTEAGPAVVFHGFVPPYGPWVEAWPGAGPAGDGDLLSSLQPGPPEAVELTLPAARPLGALTLAALAQGPRLPRSLDVSVSADGASFETVVRRRRREERRDLRWLNGHPQYVIDHDLLAVPLAGRPVRAVRIAPVSSTEPWALAEVLLHPPARHPVAWDEWLNPRLGWEERKRALAERPRPDREDWYWRSLLAARH